VVPSPKIWVYSRIRRKYMAARFSRRLGGRATKVGLRLKVVRNFVNEILSTIAYSIAALTLALAPAETSTLDPEDPLGAINTLRTKSYVSDISVFNIDK
jgi:hypothetical protein